jgi:hypothetical protein
MPRPVLQIFYCLSTLVLATLLYLPLNLVFPFMPVLSDYVSLAVAETIHRSSYPSIDNTMISPGTANNKSRPL